jgi:hypothetical protein
MSIEVNADLDIDRPLPGGLRGQLDSLEKRNAMLATVAASVENLETLKETLCGLRASGISPMVLLKPVETPLTTDEILAVFAFLRDWDQLLLRNVLEVASARIDPKYVPSLIQEAKIEFKWFQEWQTAVADPRIHRYPGLPWRSFLRKVNAENFEFSQLLLRDDSTGDTLDLAVKAFLVGKKKTICVFPKNWGKK